MRLRMAWFAVVILPVVMLLLLSGNVAYAAPPATVSHSPMGGAHEAPPATVSLSSTDRAHEAPPATVSLNLNGGVVSPGVQTYSLQGGHLAAAWVLGTPVDPRSAVLHYGLNVVVSGLTATGTASFGLATQTSHRSYMEVKGTVKIDAMTPAVLFPLGCTPGLDCLSEIPALFNGTGTVTVSSGRGVATMSLSMGFESAYLNPFGGPVFFASNSGEIFVIADYSQARIQWTGVQMGGSAVGTFGGASVSGGFGMLVNSSEDLRSGTEMDRGIISFFGMSNPALDGLGSFIGHSMIPAGSSVACPGFPSGTCNLTGLESSGLFAMTTGSGKALEGRYATVWATPAVAFSSSILAFLSSPRDRK
jgi:hypothetical protein